MPESYNDNLHKEAIGKLYQYGRELRHELTQAEKFLWAELRNRKLKGLKFRRQHPIDTFVLDFYCHERKLAIELDGSIHDGKLNKEYDEARTAMLGGLGIYTLRFRNDEVINNIESVLRKINEVTNMLQAD
jgi:very-short-patch-repair endonuclease